MYFLHAINSDRQTRLLNVLGQIAMILGDKKKIWLITKNILRCTVSKTSKNQILSQLLYCLYHPIILSYCNWFSFRVCILLLLEDHKMTQSELFYARTEHHSSFI